jgi:two-component system NtrC family sensor kinase
MSAPANPPHSDEALHRDRMATVGQLAAGIAHEINTPLAFIRSNLGTMEQYVATVTRSFATLERYVALTQEIASPEARAVLAAAGFPDSSDDLHFILTDLPDLVHESLVGARRAAEIIEGLRRFGRLDPASAAEIDVHEVLDSALTLTRNELRYRCDVLKDYGDLPRIHALPAQLSQVFMNMLINAAQSMIDRGTITLTTRAAQDRVLITIADTGRGIASEHLPKLFAPFFSHRHSGDGTGLGLSIAQAIVHKHGGRIDVHSEVGAGSEFTITLPVRPESLSVSHMTAALA